MSPRSAQEGSMEGGCHRGAHKKVTMEGGCLRGAHKKVRGWLHRKSQVTLRSL